MLASVMSELDTSRDFGHHWLSAKWCMIEAVETITDYEWLEPENTTPGAVALLYANLLDVPSMPSDLRAFISTAETARKKSTTYPKTSR